LRKTLFVTHTVSLLNTEIGNMQPTHYNLSIIVDAPLTKYQNSWHMCCFTLSRISE